KAKSLSVYVAWVPILPADERGPNEETVALVPDPRARHFWDVKGTLPPLFQKTLGLTTGFPAWDVYLIYRRGQRWGKAPPKPVYWQHQLPTVPAIPRLDGKSFSAQLRKILEGERHLHKKE